MKIKRLFLIFMLFIVCGNTIYSDNEYGLFIKAFPFNNSEKTSLVLENGQAFRLSEETTISFELYVRKDNVFGVVSRMLMNNKDNIDLIFTVGDNDKRYPMLVIKESVYPITEQVQCEEWVPVSITFSKNKDLASIDYNGTKITEKYSFSGTNSILISFGLCPFENFVLSDIASVNIRNIRITENNHTKRFWKLDKHTGNISNDSVASVPAIVTNPQWITDMYSTWQKIYSEEVSENSMFAYNPKDNLIYIVAPDSRSIKVINPEDHSAKTIEAKEGFIASLNSSNQIFYDPARNELVTYNLNENIASRFSFNTQTWSNQAKPTEDNGYINNSISFSEEDSTFISFGGYGFYKYNNEIIRLDKEGKIIKKSRLPEISSRYSSSTAIINNTLYILGGRGNKSGRQELSPKNVYDFYSVNLLTEQVNKIWEDERINIDFLPGENMIFDPDQNCFYVYTTNEGGMLMRVSMDKKGFEQMSFPINEDLVYHYLYTNLYFSPEKKKFYALVNKANPDKSSEATIYSLDYPPRPISITEEPSITEEAATTNKPFSLLYLSLIIAGIAALGALYYFTGKRAKKRNTPVFSEKEKEQNPQEASIQSITEKEDTVYYDFSKSSVCLLGGFYVSDKAGQNITGQFTPMLKQLLILLILNTIKDPKGISGKKLIQTLWYDKSEDSAKNNRNVYMSKLRAILENIGDIEIVNQNGFWSVDPKDVQCDYWDAMTLFSGINETGNIDSCKVSRLLELLLRGVLLPNTELDWTDGFKSDFSNLTIDVLKHLVHDPDYHLSNELKLKIADTIFLHDYINEDALYLKCHILYNSGKKGIAKTVYDNFIREYAASLGVNYKYTLQDVVNGKIL